MKGYSLTGTVRDFPYAMWLACITSSSVYVRVFPRALSLSAVEVMPRKRKVLPSVELN